jgi:hypothetical protein
MSWIHKKYIIKKSFLKCFGTVQGSKNLIFPIQCEQNLILGKAK